MAVRLKRYSIARKYPELESNLDSIDNMPMPMWLKVAPYIVLGNFNAFVFLIIYFIFFSRLKPFLFCIKISAIYFVLGIICFGVARRRPFVDSLLFPLDFTAAGGLSTTSSHVRIFYALYLEGAVTLAAVAVAVLKVSATQSLTNIGLKYGLLVPA